MPEGRRSPQVADLAPGSVLDGLDLLVAPAQAAGPATTPQPAVVPAAGPAQRTPGTSAGPSSRRPARVPRAASVLAAAGVPVVTTAVALLVFSRRIGAPSPWQGETATLAACRRSLADLLALTQRSDQVHLGYYLLVRAALSVHDSLASARAVSVVAMALAAGLLASLARRTAGPGVGLAAGAVLVALPWTSRWAQDAGPAALAALLATASTWWLVRAVAGRSRPLRWGGYAVCLVTLGFVDGPGLLILAAHGTFLVVTASWRQVRQWLGVVCLTGIPLGPWLLLTFGQRDQAGGIGRPRAGDLVAWYGSALGSRVLPLLLLLAALGILWRRRQGRLPGRGAGRAIALGAAWAVVPPVLHWAVCTALPPWQPHTAVFALPGVALWVAAATAGVVAPSAGLPERVAAARTALTGAALAAVAGVVAVAGLPLQTAYRDAATGHDHEDARGAAQYVAHHARPGDAVLFVPVTLRTVRAAYPGDFATLTDLALARSPAESGTLHGEDVAIEDLRARLTGHGRVWVLTRAPRSDRPAPDAAAITALRAGYREAERASLPGFRVTLYVSARATRT